MSNSDSKFKPIDSKLQEVWRHWGEVSEARKKRIAEELDRARQLEEEFIENEIRAPKPQFECNSWKLVTDNVDSTSRPSSILIPK